MKQYQSQEVAGILDISTATLRAHSKALENAGYEFKRNASKQRQYSDKDVDILRAMLALKNEHGLSLKEAIDKVSSADFAPSSVLQPIAERQSESPSAPTAQPINAELYAVLEMLTDEMVALKGENQALREQLSALERKQDATLKAISESVNESSATEEIAKVKEQIAKLSDSRANGIVLNEVRKLSVKLDKLEEQSKESESRGFWARLFGK